jgi:hypothetical protein
MEKLTLLLPKSILDYMIEENSQQPVTKEDMQDLLAEQSKIILGAVDEKIGKLDNRIDGVED